MANSYYDYNNGDNGDSGLTPALAKAAISNAEGVAGGGDKVIAVDGSHAHESNRFNFAANRVYSAETFRGATLLPHASETTYTARTSASFSAANNPLIVENLIVDGNAQCAEAFEIGQDATEDTQIRLNSLHIKNGTQYGLLINHRRGRVEINNLKLSESGAQPMLMTTASLSNDGNQAVDINRVELDGSKASGSLTGMQITKVNNLTNTLDLKLKNIVGVLEATGTALSVGISVKTVNPNVSNCDITIQATETAGTGHFGIICQGQSVAVATNPIIAQNKITFNANAGYAIALGQSTSDANVTGGEVSGNFVISRYDPIDTMHGILMGQGVAGATMRGNTAQDFYAGYLASKCTSGTIEGNLAFDCYGVSYYVKGTTDITLQDNIAVVTSKHLRPSDERAVLAVAPQGATNTAAAAIQRNLVIVQDITKINALAYIEDVNQVCEYKNNTYIISDSVDILTTDLFVYENGIGGAANNTLVEWNAQTEVTNDVIVQLPDSEISALINSLKPSSGSTGSSALISNSGIISQ